MLRSLLGWTRQPAAGLAAAAAAARGGFDSVLLSPMVTTGGDASFVRSFGRQHRDLNALSSCLLTILDHHHHFHHHDHHHHHHHHQQHRHYHHHHHYHPHLHHRGRRQRAPTLHCISHSSTSSCGGGGSGNSSSNSGGGDQSCKISINSSSSRNSSNSSSSSSNSNNSVVSLTHIKQTLHRSKVPFSQAGYTCLRVRCPRCAAGDRRPKVDVQGFLNRVTGMFMCFECELVTDWQSIQLAFRTGCWTDDSSSSCSSNSNSCSTTAEPGSVEQQPGGGGTRHYSQAFATKAELAEVQRRIACAVDAKDVDRHELSQLLKRLGLQRILAGTLARAGYRIAYGHTRHRNNDNDDDDDNNSNNNNKNHNSNDNNTSNNNNSNDHGGDDDDDAPKIILPVRGYRGQTVGLKYLGVNGRVVETYPRELLAGFFYTESAVVANQAVLVPHPADAILVTQETQMPAVAVESTSHLPVTSLPLLEHFDKLIFWFGHSLAEWNNAKTYARKLSEARSHYVRPAADLDRPLTTKNVGQALSLEVPILHQSLVTFRELRAQLHDYLLQWESAAGIPWTRFPGLNRYLKGHRRGELTVFTGQTGSGKTTFLCEYSLDLLMQGVRTLWGSFEIANVRLLKTLLTQFAMTPLENDMARYDEIADSFERLPMYLMKFHGQERFQNVLSAMSHAVYVNDIQHVIVDNLQFMMGVSEDRFLRQDSIISAMRKFATEHNVHVTLVVHPRKEKEEDMLGNASIYGSAKASQEADNVLILQRSPRGSKYIQVTKNRFDGDVGAFPLHFDKSTLSFSKPQQQQPQRK